MEASTEEIDYIKVIDINDHLACFYWGRHKDHYHIDMRLGGCAYVIHKGKFAIIVDTMTLPGQGDWVKQYLQSKYAVENYTVVNTHWHLDHITENYLFEDGNIVGHTETRAIILANKDAIESGTLWGPPAFPVVPPNVTFEGRLDLWLDDLKVELHEFAIHAQGHISVILPEDKILIAGDMLEDPIWIFNLEFASPEKQLAELERMMKMDIDLIYSSHCNLDTIKAGGYDTNFIKNNANYLKRMLADADNPDFLKKPAQDYIEDALAAGDITWWEPYAEVHAKNIDTIRNGNW